MATGAPKNLTDFITFGKSAHCNHATLACAKRDFNAADGAGLPPFWKLRPVFPLWAQAPHQLAVPQENAPELPNPSKSP